MIELGLARPLPLVLVCSLGAGSRVIPVFLPPLGGVGSGSSLMPNAFANSDKAASRSLC
ncbi:hypothetical protein [Photobacterium damselae]|uniref:hypothetical protein n=1 Tax=Photobacterium damselae TaxID=38293 RepID=UPI0012FD8F25|nr:hypothetical protein [Photobacterium damselae]